MGLAIFEKNSFFSFFRAPYNFFWTQKLNLASKTSLLGGHLLTSKQWFLRFPGLRLPKQVIFNSETINWIKEFKKYDPPPKVRFLMPNAKKWNLSINSPSPEGASSCMIVICFFNWNMNFQGSLPLKRPPHPVCAHKY